MRAFFKGVGVFFSQIAAVLAILGLSASANAVEQWVSAPAPAAYVRGIRLFPSTPIGGHSVLYASTLGAGVVRVVHDGSSPTASQINTGLPLHRIRTIAATDVNTLFAAVDSWGVYKSADSGANWTVANGSGGTALGCLELRNISVRTVSEIWALGACQRNSGVYRSLDGGATWTRLGAGTIPDDAAVGSITFSGTGPTTVAVIATGRDGMFRSADNGATWTQINNGIAQPRGANRLSVFNASFLSNASSMLAWVEGDGVYRTTDGGANWTASGTGLPAGMASVGGISRESATIHYIGSDKGPVYRTTDGGLNWSVWGTTGSGEDTSYVRGVTIDSTAVGRYWVHGANGLFVTNDSGVTFTEVAMPRGSLSGANIHPNQTTAYIASFDVYKVPDVYGDWQASAIPIGGGLTGAATSVYVDTANAGTLYASVPNKGVYKTINDGGTWANVSIPNRETGSSPVLEIALADTQTIYAGLDNKYGTATGGGIQKSTNGGSTWSDSSSGLTTPEARQVNSIAVTTDPALLVIATDDGLYRSANAGATWTRVLAVNDGTGMPLPFSGVRYDVSNPTIAWAAAQHVDPDGTVRASSGIYKSIDGGASWTQVLAGKRASVVRPEGTGRVLAMFERDLSQPAILATKDGGATWQSFNNGILENDGTGMTRTSNTAGSHLLLGFTASGAYILSKQALSVGVTGSGTVATVSVASGTTASSATPIACPGTCTSQIFDNDVVILSAAPASGYVFRGWGGACSGTGACQVTMDAAKSVTASFTMPEAIPRMVGISTRMQVLTGDNVIIGGFIISGSLPKTVVVRARGPSLGVAGAMADPMLTLVPAVGGPVQVNDDWQTAANASTLLASGYAPGDPKEAALYATLPPGGYTAIVQGVNNTTGIAIVEVYEADHPENPLTGIATRGFVQTGDNVMIGGVIIQGDSPQTVVVRARGPSTGVAGALADPTLTLVPAAGGPVLFNDDWQTDANAAALQASGFAPGNTKESALLVTLNPGAYTAIVSGANNTTGIAIVEVYKP